MWGAEFGCVDFKCVIKCQRRSLIVLFGCNFSWLRLGGIGSGCVVLVSGLGQRPENHTELWNLGHSSPQACRSFFPKPRFFCPPSFTLYSRIKWDAGPKFRLGFQASAEKIFGIQAAPRTAAQTWIKFQLHLSLITKVFSKALTAYVTEFRLSENINTCALNMKQP